MASALRSLISRAVAACVAAAFVSALAVASMADYRLTVWPPHADSPQFNLRDVDGRPRALADFRGRVVVILFGFVHCPDACPTELFQLALVMKQLGTVSDRIQVLFVTLDPPRDTPAVLKSYVTNFDPRFAALTGTGAQIDAAATSFFVQYAKVGSGAEYVIDHSTSIYLIDASGRLRLIGGMKTAAADYAHDLRMLVAEPAPRAPH